MISDVLSDNTARTPAFGEQSYLYFPGRDVAAKTGTTNDYRDAWIVGYTPSLVVGARAGNNDNSPMEKKVAGFIIAPLWNAFMQEALKSLPNEPLPKPEPTDLSAVKPVIRGVWQGGLTYIIDRFSGKKATEYTPPEAQQEKVVGSVHSILYFVNRNDPRGPAPSDPSTDSQFRLWEYAVREWATSQHLTDESEAVIPSAYDDIHVPANKPRISITGIANGATYQKNSRVTVSASGAGTFPMSRFDFYMNGVFLGSVKKAPFMFSFTPGDIDGLRTQNELEVIGYDSVLNKSETSVPFTVL